jgi:hypothetical protein
LIKTSNSEVVRLNDHAHRQLVRFQRGCHGPHSW